MQIRQVPWVVAAVLLAAPPLAACTSSEDAAGRPRASATTAPEPRPEGVLVPGGSIVLGAHDAEVDASFTGGTFQMTAAAGDQSLTFASTEGTMVGPTGYPIRCGDAAFPVGRPTVEARTEVAGPAAQVFIGTEAGDQVSMAVISPAMQKAHPDQPEKLARLPLAELMSTVLVTPEQAQQLADQPADDPLIVHRWSHDFAAGLTVDAEMGGSLARDLFYRFAFSGAGRGREATNLSGLPCNDRSVIESYAEDATYGLVLLTGGTTLEVEGDPVTDTVADPTMQGEWAVTKVTKAVGAAKAEDLDANGDRVAHWTLTYTDPADAD